MTGDTVDSQMVVVVALARVAQDQVVRRTFDADACFAGGLGGAFKPAFRQQLLVEVQHCRSANFHLK